MKRSMRTSLMITIPFVLLLNSDSVVITTQMHGDKSGIRRVQATADSSMSDEILKWTYEMARGFYREPVHKSTDSVEVARSNQVNNLGAIEGVTATAADIVQKPLAFTTTYTFEETVKVDFIGTEQERAASDVIVFQYRLSMPGQIKSATPAGAEIDGNSCTWKLDPSDLEADTDELTVSATATSLRWDVIVLLVYVGGYLLYRIISFFVKRARLRPRKI
ncbi:MAG: hypothetical protein GF393_00810 [Armatimonadia bacterium]|nr:hypothetical protein [Armatimonadia bacterium]